MASPAVARAAHNPESIRSLRAQPARCKRKLPAEATRHQRIHSVLFFNSEHHKKKITDIKKSSCDHEAIVAASPCALTDPESGGADKAARARGPCRRNKPSKAAICFELRSQSTAPPAPPPPPQQQHQHQQQHPLNQQHHHPLHHQRSPETDRANTRLRQSTIFRFVTFC